jgi:hypothetical protein
MTLPAVAQSLDGSRSTQTVEDITLSFDGNVHLSPREGEMRCLSPDVGSGRASLPCRWHASG